MTRRKGDYFLPDILVLWDEHSGNQSTTSIRAGGPSGDCLAQHLHRRVVENVCSPLPLCPGLGEGSSTPLLTVAPRFAPHPEVGQQLCAGREHRALTWVDNTQGKDTDFFHLLQNGILFAHCSCSFLFSALTTIPGQAGLPLPTPPGLLAVSLGDVPGQEIQLHPSRAPAPQLVAHGGSLGHRWSPSGWSCGARGHPWDSHGAP